MSENWPSKEQEIWFQAGVTGERQRIIKLLEAEQLHDPDISECWCGSWREAVALIKGEENGYGIR